MVARITPSISLRNILHYNENKLAEKDAVLIHSAGFGKDTAELTFNDKLKTLQKLTTLRESTTVNSIHISLNFDPSERLTIETLRRIADSYMQKIGFGKQPYLVYQHHDADHPHIHIVTTNIRSNGKAINLHYIGRDKSEPARKQIEKDFNLVRAGSAELKQAYELKAVSASKVLAGKNPQTGIKRAITNVLDHVLPSFLYSSLPELNAILQQYNIVADRGSKDSRIYRNNGLVYRVLNEKGQKIGVPIPASHIYSKPTLAFLETKFTANERLKQRHKLRVKNAIDMAFFRHPKLSLDELTAALRKEKIILVPRRNEDGQLYGITYVDMDKKTVFNGRKLGEEYSANQIRQRCSDKEILIIRSPQQQQQKNSQSSSTQAIPGEKPVSKTISDGIQKLPSLPNIELPKADPTTTAPAATPAELLMERKKKKRKKQKH